MNSTLSLLMDKSEDKQDNNTKMKKSTPEKKEYLLSNH
jgi:hypothetical protein